MYLFFLHNARTWTHITRSHNLIHFIYLQFLFYSLAHSFLATFIHRFLLYICCVSVFHIFFSLFHSIPFFLSSFSCILFILIQYSQQTWKCWNFSVAPSLSRMPLTRNDDESEKVRAKAHKLCAKVCYRSLSVLLTENRNTMSRNAFRWCSSVFFLSLGYEI